MVKMKAGTGARTYIQDEAPYQSSRMRRKSARNEFAGADRIIHHIQWQYRKVIKARYHTDANDQFCERMYQVATTGIRKY
jgi:hypothetical protein